MRRGSRASKESCTNAPKRSVSVTGKSRVGIASPPTMFETCPVLRLVCVPSRISVVRMREYSAPATMRWARPPQDASASPMATSPRSSTSYVKVGARAQVTLPGADRQTAVVLARTSTVSWRTSDFW